MNLGLRLVKEWSRDTSLLNERTGMSTRSVGLKMHGFNFHSDAFHCVHQAHIPLCGMRNICRVGSTLCPSTAEVAKRSFH